MISILFIGAMLVLMWALLIQPQRRRQQKQARLLSELAVGDDVVTLGGLYGRVQSVDEDAVMLEIAPQTNVRVAKSAVAARITPEAENAPAPLT
ncbi:MAG: preprotein translocase subunit YajC [Actinobacteria bacterium]|nr:preprotein translocase subunit YajC [Actinomycetota bacterium]